MQKMFRIFVITAIVAIAWEGEFNPSYAQPTEPASAPAPTDTMFKLPDRSARRSKHLSRFQNLV